MKTILFTIILVFFSFGCGKEGGETKVLVERKPNVDMSEKAVSKRWFESNYKNSYQSITRIDGGCVGWGGDGKCAYKFSLKQGERLSPKNTYISVECANIYEGFTYFFELESKAIKQEDLICTAYTAESEFRYLGKHKLTGNYFSWATFVLQ